MKRSEHAATVVARLASDLFQAEASQDEAVSQLGRLAQSLTRSRREAGLSATVGQAAFDALADAVAAQIGAQRAMVALHEALADVKRNTSWRSVQMGGLEKSDEPLPRPTGLALVS
ncbi:MAG: hypothetical protein KKC29_00535 [Alphaproteobacteria bacterium]|jgi:hypothetical protein|nr:hypothetical protein [Alphaproteobacteria bacterium]MBU2041019.1 hypothetical protein [Alphaproteobacteria bacterium]MBU2127096.1 hypothetical protein [Alphaproteobacteria bacterium]MBU2207802.1 hypothetical protein [Alphaproteobacteria bacterium]MBU2289574.1 hypothetical protein [Alphaproteobacteria bacterium]